MTYIIKPLVTEKMTGITEKQNKYGFVVRPEANKIELKKEIESRYNELKADTRSEARVERDSVKSKLEELQEHLKDGWDNVTDRGSAELNDWLDGK